MNLDKTLETMESSVIEMASGVLEQHRSCLALLSSKDKELALKVIGYDEFINKKEEDINNQAIAGFALLSPVASDLRRVLVAVKIAGELERIGDYAKSLASFIIKHDQGYHELLEYAIVMEKEVIVMLEKAMQSYEEHNLELAFEIPKRDEAVNELLKEFKERLSKTTDIDMGYFYYLVSLFRSIERAGDHITNICEDVVFLIKGIHYDFD